MLLHKLLGLFAKKWATRYKASYERPEAETKQSESIYKAIIEVAPIGVAITDLEGNITHFSPQAEALTSFKEQSVRGKNLGQIFPVIGGNLNSRIEEKGGLAKALPFTDSTGRKKHLKLTLIPPTRLSAQPQSFVLFLEDITKIIEEIEETVRLKEKLVAAKQRDSEGQLQTMVGKQFHFKGVVGQSNEMQRIYRLIQKAAATTTRVLITGEPGTGKELVARAVHMNGPRRDKPFVSVNCGGILQTLLEDELFGHVRGAFTGAVSDHPGQLELADGGTIFLDEVEKLPKHLQVKLLRVLESMSFTPVGGTKPLVVDLRVISASNKDLKKEIDQGRFREDLFYRLSVIQIDLPPLRSRKEDIPSLIQHFIKKFAQASNKEVEDISPATLRYLMHYNYSHENIRELESIVEHTVSVTDRDVVTEGDLPLYVRENLSSHFKPVPSPEDVKLLEITEPVEEAPFFGRESSLDDALVSYEKSLLMAALKKAGGIQKRAAGLLGINYRSLRHRLEKYRMLESKMGKRNW
ncbi:MAG: sigma 54-interacting transcriptional regulator [Deltaproteobacteria bacterium]|nr:sigma 54-interacting transcriptional regulator [Deltaproteobacteria bacterium]